MKAVRGRRLSPAHVNLLRALCSSGRKRASQFRTNGRNPLPHSAVLPVVQSTGFMESLTVSPARRGRDTSMIECAVRALQHDPRPLSQS